VLYTRNGVHQCGKLTDVHCYPMFAKKNEHCVVIRTVCIGLIK